MSIWNPRTLVKSSDDHRLTRFLYLRLLGVMLFFAFYSLSLQKNALIGSAGILPISETLSGEGSTLNFFSAPSLFWLSSSDTVTTMTYVLGWIACIGLIANVAPRYCLAIAWICYASFSSAGSIFFNEPVDQFLLEMTLLSIFLAPKHINPCHPQKESPPSMAVIWLMRLLIFKVFICAGLSKVLSPDFNWREVSYLETYYLTMPIPSWMSWYFHQFRPGFHGYCDWAMYMIQIIIPFYIFAPRKLRITLLPLLMVQQVLIAITGNFGLMAYLQLTLCIMILDDNILPKLKAKLFKENEMESKPTESTGKVTLVFAGLLFLLSMNNVIASFFGKEAIINGIHRQAENLHLSHSYYEPTSIKNYRRSAIIEGSHDGQKWDTMPLLYLPTETQREMPILSFHLPRLDLKLHEAAQLENFDDAPWLNNLLKRVNEGNEDLAYLFDDNPFHTMAPKHSRVRLYYYSYTDLSLKELRVKNKSTDDFPWWIRRADKVILSVSK